MEDITKEDLKELCELLDSKTLSLGPKPHTIEEDENGLLHLVDADGVSRVLMPKDVYFELIEYNLVDSVEIENSDVKFEKL